MHFLCIGLPYVCTGTKKGGWLWRPSRSVSISHQHQCPRGKVVKSWWILILSGTNLYGQAEVYRFVRGLDRSLNLAPQVILVESLGFEQLPGRPETCMWFPLGGTPLFLHFTQIHFLLWSSNYRGSSKTVQLLSTWELSLASAPKFLHGGRLSSSCSVFFSNCCHRTFLL